MRIRLASIALLVLVAGCGGAGEAAYAPGPPMTAEEYRSDLYVILEDATDADDAPLTGDAQKDLERQYHEALPEAMRTAAARLRTLRPPTRERDVHSALVAAFTDAAEKLEELDVEAGSDAWFGDAFAALQPIEDATERLKARGYNLGY